MVLFGILVFIIFAIITAHRDEEEKEFTLGEAFLYVITISLVLLAFIVLIIIRL